MTIEAPALSERMRAMRAMKPMVPIEERFWAKVEPEPNSGCWLWIGATTAGYGVLGRGRREEGVVLAHRFAYVLLRGEIPGHLEPDHLCRMPPCVNPWHLELVTRRVNFLRSAHPNAAAYRRRVLEEQSA